MNKVNKVKDSAKIHGFIINKERIKHIFQFMEYDNLNESQFNLVQSYESYYHRNGFLTKRQMEVLEDIFKEVA